MEPLSVIIVLTSDDLEVNHRPAVELDRVIVKYPQRAWTALMRPVAQSARAHVWMEWGLVRVSRSAKP